jgi:hypothetical protein
LGRAGVLGYFFNKMKFQLAPLVVGLILGPNIEKHFRETLFLSQSDPWIYVEIAVAIWLLVAAILIAGFIARRRAAFAEAMAQDSSEAPSRQRRACLPRRSLGVDGSRPSTCFPRDRTCMLATRRVGGALGHSVMSAYVKVFGCRPHDGVAVRTGPASANLQGRKPREGHVGGAAWAMGI